MSAIFALLLALSPGMAYAGMQPTLRPPVGFQGFLADPSGRVCWGLVAGSWVQLDTCLARRGPGILGVYTNDTQYQVAEFRSAIWRVVGVAPVPPVTCNTTNAGVLVYVDDTSDNNPAQVCVCLATGATTYAWRNIANLVANSGCTLFP